MGRTRRAATDRPNIVWLLSDHHAFAHHRAGPGPSPVLRTHDRIAAGGVTFPNACAVCPLCTPARASMLTGVYPHRHGMVMNNGDCGSRLDFDPDEKLFAHFLREAGYRVGYFGKWHVGDERGPGDYGFEGWSMLGYGYPYWTDAYAEYLRERRLPQAAVDVEWHFSDAARTGAGVLLKDEPDWYRRMECCGVMTTPVETHEAFFVANRAAEWLEGVAATGDPFCLRVDVWGPHHPYWVAEPFANTVRPADIPEYPNFAHDLSDRPESHRRFRDSRDEHGGLRTWDEWRPVVARCYEHVTQVDAALGIVLDTLDRLGLDETLVFYTADHGDAIASHGGVFDKDSLMVEETERVPLAVRWPGQIAPGSTRDQLVTQMDLVPTLLDAAGAAGSEPMDGRSLLGILADADAPWREDLLCEHHGHGHPCFQRMLRHGPWKYVAHLGDTDELYDLSRDPCEGTNLAEDRSRRGVLADMQRRLAGQMEAFGDGGDDASRLRKEFI